LKTILEMTVLELKLLLREPITVIFTFGLPLIFLPVLGTVFGNIPDPTLYRGFGSMDFYTPAYVGLVIASIGLIQLPLHLANYKERRILRRFRASSISAISVFGSQILVSLLIALIGAIAVTMIGILFYNVHLPQDWIGVIGAFVLSVLCFVAIGFLLGAILPNARSAQGAGLILYLVMMLLGGAGAPSEFLGKALRFIGDLTPLRHVVTLLQDSWLGFGWNYHEMFIVGAILVGASLLSLRFFHWE
jgi:ABC-2 type transport system permease protein